MRNEPGTGIADRMALLHGRLREIVAGADVRLLSGDQVLVTRNMVRNPALDRGGKVDTYVPGVDGYRVHVAGRPAPDQAARAALSQRMTGPSARPVEWDARTMRLRLDPDGASRDWLLGDHRGDVVTVHAAAGSARVVDAVNAVLSEVEAVLLT